jgi:enolase
MAIINSVSSRWILDSRGIPTLTCTVVIDQQGKKSAGTASVPSGASTGTYEAHELRDGGSEFHGKGVNKAVENVLYKIGERIIGRNFQNAAAVDEFILSLDTTENKKELGANSILAVSMAVHRAFAEQYGLDLWQYLRRLYFSTLPANTKFPRLMCNVINGGQHADNTIDIQEFMIVPNTQDIESDVRLASEVYHTLKAHLKKLGLSTALGDEGGFAPQLDRSKDVLSTLTSAIEKAGYTNLDCALAMDCAANEFYNADKGIYELEGQNFSHTKLVDYYKELKEEFNILSIEDGFNEDDVLGWELMTQTLGPKIHLIGDDLFVTNPVRFSKLGVEQKLGNGILIKLNQIGSVSETCKVINMAKENGFVIAVSHRSGETNDDFIADLSVASQAEFIKLGAPARGERVAKFNRLLEIKESLE